MGGLRDTTQEFDKQLIIDAFSDILVSLDRYLNECQEKHNTLMTQLSNDPFYVTWFSGTQSKINTNATQYTKLKEMRKVFEQYQKFLKDSASTTVEIDYALYQSLKLMQRK